jgi:hypothetical protein
MSRREYCVGAVTGLIGAYSTVARPHALSDATMDTASGDLVCSGISPSSAQSAPRVLHPVWDRLDSVGLEAANIGIAPRSVELVGNVVLEILARCARLRSITCNGNWEFQHANLFLDTAGIRRTLSLDRIGERWRVNGAWRPNFSDCRDIDIVGTPSTNTLPIRRLPWKANESRNLQMAFVGLPNLDVCPMMQRYSRIADGPRNTAHFRYESIVSGFKAELLIDSDGLVLTYPPIWQRAAGSEDV